jgi:hypothetical protein
MPQGAPADKQSDVQSGNGDMAPFERWLDRKLKTVYGSVLEEPIPQDLLDLLKSKLDGT